MVNFILLRFICGFDFNFAQFQVYFRNILEYFEYRYTQVYICIYGVNIFKVCVTILSITKLCLVTSDAICSNLSVLTPNLGKSVERTLNPKKFA